MIKKTHIIILFAVLVVASFVVVSTGLLEEKVPYEGDVEVLFSIAPPKYEQNIFMIINYIEFLYQDTVDGYYAINKTTKTEYLSLLEKPSVHYVYEFGHGGMFQYMIPAGEYNGININRDEIVDAFENRQPVKIAFLNSCQCFYYTGVDGWEPNSVSAPKDKYGYPIDYCLRKGEIEGTAVFGYRDIPAWEGESYWDDVMQELQIAIFQDGMTTGEAFYHVSSMTPYQDFCHDQLRMSGDTDLKESDTVYI
jgi:hypothetical protein